MELDDSKYGEVLEYLVGEIMPTLPGNAWKVLLVIFRGMRWQVSDDLWGSQQKPLRERLEEGIVLSYKELRAKTGIRSDATIKKALDELVEMGYVVRSPSEADWEGLPPAFVYTAPVLIRRLP